jgi:hypothetical protein
MDAFVYANSATNTIFGWSLLLTLWTITFISLKMQWKTSQAFMASSLTTLIVSVLLSGIGMVTIGAVYITGLLSILSVLMISWENSKGWP